MDIPRRGFDAAAAARIFRGDGSAPRPPRGHSVETGAPRRYAAKNGHAGALEHWDVPFWAERLREEKFAFSEEELRPYFALPAVLDGLFGVIERLFGVTVAAADGKADTWWDDVRYFEISDAAGDVVASFYLDPYVRRRGRFLRRIAATPRPRRGYSFGESWRRRGRDADIPSVTRGDAAAATWILRGGDDAAAATRILRGRRTHHGTRNIDTT